MERLLILGPLLYAISNGGLFRFVFTWFLRIAALFVIIATLWASWQLWSSLGNRSPISYFLAALVVEAAILAAGFVVLNILIYRSNDIMNIPDVKDYPTTPIIVLLIKTVGEIVASLYILIGSATGISFWIVGNYRVKPALDLPFLTLGYGASGGSIMVLGLLLGFGELLSSYFLAEMIGAPVDIVRNTRR